MRAAAWRGWSRVAAAAASIAALAGCAPLIVGGAVAGGAMVATDRRTSGTQVEDQVIELKANGRMNDALGDRARINTTSYNRMVLLTGEVENEADKATAEQVVARIENVASVVNELSIGPPNTLKERTADGYITTRVKTSLVDANDIFANSVKVVSHRGTVYLMGKVSEREARRATEIARRVEGVVKVVRVFEIVPPGAPAAASAASTTAS